MQLSSAYIPAVISPVFLIFNVLAFRNNLTVLDGIVVQGQGARGEFTLNGKRPGTHSTLLFEIKPSQLADCHSELLCTDVICSLSTVT